MKDRGDAFKILLSAVFTFFFKYCLSQIEFCVAGSKRKNRGVFLLQKYAHNLIFVPGGEQQGVLMEDLEITRAPRKPTQS